MQRNGYTFTNEYKLPDGVSGCDPTRITGYPTHSTKGWHICVIGLSRLRCGVGSEYPYEQG